MKAIFAVMNTTQAVVKTRLKKIQACMRFEPKNMKAIFTVMNTTKAVVKTLGLKKIQACRGFETMTSVTLVLSVSSVQRKILITS